jgi:probable F420-dependent oxidoreductase
VTHPFRFAVRSSQISSGRELRERARQAEDLGYYAYHVTDHVLGPGEAMARAGHAGSGLAVVPALMALADATDHLRVGSRVICLDFHHPVVLANEMATIDLFSGGRLELGLGAGWLANEYQAMGIPFDAAGTRIARLAEAVCLIKLLFGDGPVSYHGEHFQVEGFEGAPRPVQRPRPPIVIGGGAERVLRLAGREADIVSLNYNNRSGVLGPDGVQKSTAEFTLQKIDWIRQGAGARFHELEIDIGIYYTAVTDDPLGVAERMGSHFGLAPADVMEHPHALIGSPHALCEELERRRELFGISYVAIGADAAIPFAPVVHRLAGK